MDDASSLKDYKVLEQIGKGAYAVVREAWCKKTKKKVAIKGIRHVKEMEQRVNDEIRIHSSLNHHNIVKVYQHFQDNKYVYLILELCTANLQSHANMLKDKRFNVEDAIRYFSQILDGMLYLHNRKILHRDLKLSNILLNEENVIKIADFGLSCYERKENNGKHKTICGTVNCMSPGVLLGEEQTEKDDVWSLGIMLYTMIAGKSPYKANNLSEYKKLLKTGQYEFPNTMPVECIDLIKKCLELNPLKRIRVEDMRKHPFITPDKNVNTQSRDSGLHTVSTTGSNMLVQRVASFNGGTNDFSNGNRMQDYYMHAIHASKVSIPRNLSNGRYPDGNLAKSNISYHTNRSEPLYTNRSESSVPPLIIPSRIRDESIERIGPPLRPLKANHCVNVPEQFYSKQRYVNNQDVGVDYPYNSNSGFNGFCQDNGYSSNRNSGTDENYGCSGNFGGDRFVQQVHSCCQCTHHFSWCERKDKVNSHQSSSNKESHKDIMLEQNGSLLVNSNHFPETGISRKSALIDNSLSNMLKDKPPRLKSVRLKIIRDVKPCSVLSILDDNQVCIEYTRTIKNSNKTIVVEVYKVSSDGNDIVIYRPDLKKGIEVGDSPPKEQGKITKCDYDSLPQKQWKKYRNACNFVEDLKKKTYKIRNRNVDPTAYLMENGNFEAHFKIDCKFVFNSKWDSVKSKFDIKVNLTKGNCNYIYNADEVLFDKEDMILYEKCCKIRNNFLRMEKVLTECEIEYPDQPTFPCIIGPPKDSGTKIAMKDKISSKIYNESNKENVYQSKGRNLRR